MYNTSNLPLGNSSHPQVPKCGQGNLYPDSWDTIIRILKVRQNEHGQGREESRVKGWGGCDWRGREGCMVGVETLILCFE